MRIRISLAIGVALLGYCLISASSAATSAKKTAKKRRVRRPPTPPVSAAARAAALVQVDDYLGSSAGHAFQQPGALIPFFEQLLHAAPGSHSPVHIVQFGDSHTAADEWTGSLREQFRERFGDGGSGFSLAGHPFPGYRRFDARGGATSAWTSSGLRTGAGDGWFGLGGVAITAWRAGQSVFLDADCDQLEIHFLQQPYGGRFALYDSGTFLDEVSTQGEIAPGFVRYTTEPGPHRFLLKTLDSHPVRLFGWVADKSDGLTYEALGINGAEATLLLKWNQAMLDTYLQRRNPAMVVLSYGTNEASDPYWRHENYADAFAKVVTRIRQAAPMATILVLGPADRWIRTRGRWQLVEGIDSIVAQQQTVCRNLGCVFWDTRQRMGGTGSMKDWQTAGLAQGDRVHFTSAGYRRLANVLFSDLSDSLEAYKKVRPDAASEAPQAASTPR